MISFDVKGGEALSKKFGALEPRVWRKPMRKAMSNEMKDVRAKMRAAVPKDEGRLRKSIETNSWFIERNLGDLDIFVRTGPAFRGRGRRNGWYAHFIELGTSRSKAQPFVAPVFKSVAPVLRAKFTAALEQILKL